MSAVTQSGRPLRALVAHPGPAWSVSDVYDGLVMGLRHHGVSVIPYRLDTRLPAAHKLVHIFWRRENQVRKKIGEQLVPKPTYAHTLYQASLGLLEMALRHQVDVVIVVSAMYVHPDVLILMRRAGIKTTILFTESPYDLEDELRLAALVDGCWTNERTSLPEFKRVNPHSGYLPHGWNPQRHTPGEPDPTVPAHDVVFVGSGFPERVEFFNRIDWTGIDLGLYGVWKECGLREDLMRFVRCPAEGSEQVPNEYAVQLYRRAKIGLNLYRNRNSERLKVYAESLSPRAYELAAVGAFHISHDRPEVHEVFGDLVPTFTEPQDAERLIRQWLADDAGRARIAKQLPACVAEARWTDRAATVIGDILSLIQWQPAEMSA